MLNSWPHTGWADEYNKAAARKDYKGKTDEELHDIAYSEVVAQCCETLLSDTDAVSRLASQIKAENKTMWDKICEFFRNLAEALKNAYEGLAPGSSIANQVKETVTNVERLRDLWTSAGAGAIKNYSNALTSVFGKTNALSKLLLDAINEETSGKFSMLYWNKKEATTLLQRAGLQLPGRLIPRDGFIHSIRESASSVKPKFENVTESQQFKRWFGDWQKHPQNASKVANADGTPKVVYHQTGRDFTVFDNSTPVAGKNDSETPNGFFFKDNDHDIGLGGSKQMAVYLDMKNPLHFANRQEANNWYCQNISGYAVLQKEMSDALSPISAEMDSIENEMFSDEVTDDQRDILRQKWNELLDKMRSVEEGYRGRLRKLLDGYFLNGKSGYDGIMMDYDGHRYVNGERENVKTYIVFNRTQIKSATDNIGTFDGSNPDIRYSARNDGGMSNRQLLANAIESSVQHEAEAKRPAAYNGNDMQAD